MKLNRHPYFRVKRFVVRTSSEERVVYTDMTIHAHDGEILRLIIFLILCFGI